MLTNEQKQELSHLEDVEGMTDYEAFLHWRGDDIRMDFLEEKGLPLHSAINGELKKEFEEYCQRDFLDSFIEIDIEDE